MSFSNKTACETNKRTIYNTATDVSSFLFQILLLTTLDSRQYHFIFLSKAHSNLEKTVISHREEREREKKGCFHALVNCILLEAMALGISLKSCPLDIVHLRGDPTAGSVTETDTHDKHNCTQSLTESHSDFYNLTMYLHLF